MVDTLIRSDQDIDANLARLSKLGRVWLLTVAALGVLLVISSMVALNAALPDMAVTNGRDPDPAHLDRRRLHPGTCLPPAARRCGRRSIRAARRTTGRPRDLRGRVDRPGVFRQSCADHPGARGGRRRHRVHHACDAVPVDGGVPEERTQQGSRDLGRGRQFRSSRGVHGHRPPAAPLLVAVHLLRVCSVGPSIVRGHLHNSVIARRNRHCAGLGGRRADRRRRRSVRVRRGGSARARMDASGRLGLHGSRFRARCRVRGGRTAAQAPAAGCPTVRQTRLRYRGGRNHHPFLRQLRILLRRHAIHAADPRLQFAHDGIRAHTIGGTDHGLGRDDAPLSSEGRAADSRCPRFVPHRRGAFLHAVPRGLFDLSGSRVADAHHQRRHWLVRSANDFRDHECGPQREAGRRIGRQRHDERAGRRCRHCRRGVCPGRRVHQGPWTGTCIRPRRRFANRRWIRSHRLSRWPSRWGRREHTWRIWRTPRSSSRWICRCWSCPSSSPPRRSSPSGLPVATASSFIRRLTSRRTRSDDELGGAVANHHDGGVRSAAGDGG